jgi:ATP-dependent DNA helicase PIF1
MTTLNTEQRRAVDAALEGKNIFLTGPGGVGKSYVVQHIKRCLEDRGRRVALTALTGCAALLLGESAKTIHSWAGIGLGRESVEVIVRNIKKFGFRAKKEWFTAHTLIIDEVSMMTPELLDKLSAVGASIRQSNKPFGGLQVILVGDFHQLPPVNTDRDDDQPPPTNFAFESKTWSDLNLMTVYLTKIVRQTDPIFHQLLMEARNGELSNTSIQLLLDRMEKPWDKEQIRPTLLFSRRAEVEMINERNLKALPMPSNTYQVKTVFDATIERQSSSTAEQRQRAEAKLDRSAPYKPSLELRIGAQVMLIYNKDLSKGLVNGSRGVVKGFSNSVPSYPIVQFKGVNEPQTILEQTWASEDVEGLKRQQIPLVLAYSITIHKAQGSSIDSALIDIGASTFEVGQAYVALSRVKSLESLYVYDFEPEAFRTHPKVKAFYTAILDEQSLVLEKK